VEDAVDQHTGCTTVQMWRAEKGLLVLSHLPDAVVLRSDLLGEFGV
jgi:hypothetical protein